MTEPAAASGLFGVGLEGPAVTSEERGILQRFPPWAVILFRRNLETPERLALLVTEIGALPGPPRLVVDQEGGPVDRFRDLLGHSLSFAEAAHAGLAEEAGALAGAACRALGFSIDLAPVVDRMLPGASERVLAGRGASSDPGEIADAARLFLNGLHAAGVSGCAKHFPGLGRASLDTHQALPILPDDPEEEAKDLAPFAAVMDLAGAVMISHAAGPDGLPASLSASRATGLLRGMMGFSGPAFSDDLEMGALAAFGEVPERAAQAARAGCDLLFVCRRILEYPDCVRHVEREVPVERRAEAAGRLARYAKKAASRARHAEEQGPPLDLATLRERIAALAERAAAG